MLNESSTDVAGIKLATPGQLRVERSIATLVVVVPAAGTLVGIYGLFTRGITAIDLTLLVVFYSITMIGITVGFHRLLSHRSFEAGTGVRAFLAVSGSLSLQGPVLRWVADHRRHHAHPDRKGDPHSPQYPEGSRLRRIFHSHMGWFFGQERTSFNRYIPDLVKDPILRRIHELYPLWAIVSLGLPAALAFLLTADGIATFWAFVWGSLVRLFLVDHAIWALAWVCHSIGGQPLKTTDGSHSTNSLLLALLTFGEGWHNGHHAFPGSYRFGLLKWQVDIGAFVVEVARGLKLIGPAKAPSGSAIVARCKSSSSRVQRKLMESE